jgi:methionyl-tRNA formyltransferase
MISEARVTPGAADFQLVDRTVANELLRLRDPEPFVRGMTPWPGAYTFWNGVRLKVFKTDLSSAPRDVTPGTVLASPPGELVVAAGDGALSIREVQGASGSRLPVSEFLRGCRIRTGEILG